MMISTNIFNLTDRCVLLTGGAGILGKHFARILLEAGAKVAIVDIAADAVTAVTAELSEHFGEMVFGVTGDVADPASVTSTVECILQRFGAIDVLVNNAGTKTRDLAAFFAPFEEYDLETWREIMGVNIDGMFLMAQAVGRHMVERRRGSIIQIASIYGVMAPDQRIYEGSHYLNRQINTPAVYSASKAAVVGLSKYLATYWAHAGIRVNTISPGGMVSGQNEVFQTNYGRRVPLGRMGQPEELLGALLYLASDASSYVTGQNLLVDGGLSAW